MAETKDPIQEVKEAFTALQEEVKKVKPDPAVMEKINATLDAQEEKNQQLVLDAKAAEKEAGELKERLDSMEVELSRAGGTGDSKDFRNTPEFKAMEQFVRQGNEIPREEKELLRTDSDAAGGFLVIGEMDNVITKRITEISNLRSIARVRTISSKSLEMPIRKTIPVARFEGEAATGPKDTSTYGSETVVPFRQTITIPITFDMLADASFNMESEILSDASEAFAFGEGRNHVRGDGVRKPFGFTADDRVTDDARVTDSVGTIGFEDTMLLTGDLKTGYNPMFTLNRRTLAHLRTIKGSDGHPLWQPGMNGMVANTLNGFPYVLLNDMDDFDVVDGFPLAFGDFLRGYTIVDRTGVAVIRDEFTAKDEGIVEFNVKRWTTGQVILPEAIKLLKIKA